MHEAFRDYCHELIQSRHVPLTPPSKKRGHRFVAFFGHRGERPFARRDGYLSRPFNGPDRGLSLHLAGNASITRL